MGEITVTKIFIFGAGNLGHHIYKCLCNEDSYHIQGWIDNEKKGDLHVTDLQVFSLKSFLKLEEDESSTIVIVAIEDRIEATRVVVSLLNSGWTNILMLPFSGGTNWNVNIIKNGKFDSNVVKPWYDVKPVLNYVEYQIVDHCNLKCNNCSHFSNIESHPAYASLDEYTLSIKKLSYKFSNIKTIRLMGGEPFLNKELDAFIDVTREEFPNADIHIVTNGILVEKMDERLVSSIRRNGVIIAVTQYQPISCKINEIVSFMEDNRLKYTISPMIKSFKRTMSYGDSDFSDVWENYCFIHHNCKFLRGTKLFPCAQMALLYEKKDFFGIDIDKEEVMNCSFDLTNDEITGWDILKRLDKPFSLCRFCSPRHELVKWNCGNDTLSVENWIVKV